MGCSEDCSQCTEEVPGKSLIAVLDIPRVSAVNEKTRGSCAAVLQKGRAEKGSGVCAVSKTPQGLLVRVPFLCKVSVSYLEIQSGPASLEVFPNASHATLTSRHRITDTYTLPGIPHLVRVPLPKSKYANIDALVLRMKQVDAPVSFSYLGILGIKTSAHAMPVLVSYEKYPQPEDASVKAKDSGRNRVLY